MGLRVCAVYTGVTVFLKISALEGSEKTQAHPLSLCPEPPFHQVPTLHPHANTLTQTCTSTSTNMWDMNHNQIWSVYLYVLLSLCLSVFPDRSRSEVDLSNLGDGFSNDSLPGRCHSVPGLNDGVCSHCNCTLTVILHTKAFPSYYCTLLVKEHYLAGWYLVTDIYDWWVCTENAL